MAEEPKVPFKMQIGNRLLEGLMPMSFADAPFATALFGLPEDKQTPPFALTDVKLEERMRQLQQLLIEGFITREVLIGDCMKVTLKAGTMQEALDGDVIPQGKVFPSGANQRWHLAYDTVHTLARAVIRYGDKTWPEQKDPTRHDPEACEQFLRGLNAVVVGYLGDEYNTLCADARALCRPRVLDAIIPKS